MGIRTEEIYEALSDDSAFARLPDLIAKAANARSALMLWQHNDGLTQAVAYSCNSPTWFNDYATFAELDPYRAIALRHQNINRVLLLNDWISPTAFQNSVIYNDLIRTHDDDTVYCTGSAIGSPWGNGIIGVHRGEHHRPFDATDARRLQVVIVHAERVLRARGEILSARHATALARSALDAMGLVILMVHASGYIVERNEAAEDILCRADGLTTRNGRLAATNYQAEQKMARAIAEATSKTNPVATAISIPRRCDDAAYLVTVTPLIGRAGKSTALVLFRDPCKPDHSLTARLRALFGISTAEAAIAIDLASGLSVNEIARNRGVSTNTLRTQLKSINAKTACGSQVEFVALMRNLPPLS